MPGPPPIPLLHLSIVMTIYIHVPPSSLLLALEPPIYLANGLFRSLLTSWPSVGACCANFGRGGRVQVESVRLFERQGAQGWRRTFVWLVVCVELISLTCETLLTFLSTWNFFSLLLFWPRVSYDCIKLRKRDKSLLISSTCDKCCFELFQSWLTLKGIWILNEGEGDAPEHVDSFYRGGRIVR